MRGISVDKRPEGKYRIRAETVLFLLVAVGQETRKRCLLDVVFFTHTQNASFCFSKAGFQIDSKFFCVHVAHSMRFNIMKQAIIKINIMTIFIILHKA